MRPVAKPAVAGSSAGELLREIGEFCSICETSLPSTFGLWHPTRGVLPATVIAADEWADVLLLCRACTSVAGAARGALLLPDQDLTFTLDPRSPLTYELTELDEVNLDDDNEPIGPAEQVQRVIVRAHSAEAQATIDHFSLNGVGYDAANRRIAIPSVGHDRPADPRVKARTRAWQTASKIALNLKATGDQALRQALLTSSKDIAAGAGFWSTWATVLWATLGDRAAVAEVLMPPRHLAAIPARLAAADGLPTFGRADRFAGTRTDWLA